MPNGNLGSECLLSCGLGAAMLCTCGFAGMFPTASAEISTLAKSQLDIAIGRQCTLKRHLLLPGQNETDSLSHSRLSSRMDYSHFDVSSFAPRARASR